MDPIKSGMFILYRPLLTYVIKQHIQFHLPVFTLHSDAYWSLKRPLPRPITSSLAQFSPYVEAMAEVCANTPRITRQQAVVNHLDVVGEMH